MPITADTLAQYPNRILIETGTAGGEGTQAAITAGFPEIYTIELYEPSYAAAAASFAHLPHVNVIFGSSPHVLTLLLKQIHEPVTFWLDAHGDALHPSTGLDYCPLLDELHVIATHGIKTHTILIDDVHLFGTDLPDAADVRLALMDINPTYTLSRAQSHTVALGLDILVARTSQTDNQAQ